MRRAAANARKLAKVTGTPFFVLKDGRVKNLNPRHRSKGRAKTGKEMSP